MIERRRYPRVYLELPATVELVNEETLTVQLHDISSEGLCFVCDKNDKELITPNSQWDPAEITITIDLPDTAGNPKFEARCTVISLRRISSTRFFISVQFTKLPGSSLNNLGDFIKSLEAKD